MLRIGVIAEGFTDQQVLERFLLALCAGMDGDTAPDVNFLQPPNLQTPGNWDKVLKYVASERFRGAFASNEFVVIHVDTDVCENFTPPIRRATEDGDVPAETLITQVRDHLIACIESTAPGYYAQREAQIIWAIAVHSIECWLLPLFSDRDSDRTRRDNCLNLLNNKLSPLGFSIDVNNKGKGYTLLLKDKHIRKMKRDTVLEASMFNPGFADFAAQVEAKIIPPSIAEAQSDQGRQSAADE